MTGKSFIPQTSAAFFTSSNSVSTLVTGGANGVIYLWNGTALKTGAEI